MRVCIKMFVSFVLIGIPHSYAEAITADSIECFRIFDISGYDLDSVGHEARKPIMPPKQKVNIPPKYLNSPKKPAGVLPISIDPVTNNVVVLFGYEQGSINGFTDFGGSSDATDSSREHTAVREFNEESCLAFWYDLSGEKLSPSALSGQDLENKAKESVTDNVYPLFFGAMSKYYTCLVPVGYQSVEQIQSKIATVRRKVSSSPFFEKTDFVWVPLETLIKWIEEKVETPVIAGKAGKTISWRFLNGKLEQFWYLKNQPNSKWIFDGVLSYLKKIIDLNQS